MSYNGQRLGCFWTWLGGLLCLVISPFVLLYVLAVYYNEACPEMPRLLFGGTVFPVSPENGLFLKFLLAVIAFAFFDVCVVRRRGSARLLGYLFKFAVVLALYGLVMSVCGVWGMAAAEYAERIQIMGASIDPYSVQVRASGALFGAVSFFLFRTVL